MIRTFKTYFSFSIALLCSSFAFSQAYQIKPYGVDNGITQPYVYTVNQDKNGYLWAGTGDGACKFDGISFKSYYSSDGVAENFVTSSFKDNSRNLGWVTIREGSLFMMVKLSR